MFWPVTAFFFGVCLGTEKAPAGSVPPFIDPPSISYPAGRTQSASDRDKVIESARSNEHALWLHLKEDEARCKKTESFVNADAKVHQLLAKLEININGMERASSKEEFVKISNMAERDFLEAWIIVIRP